MTHIVTTHSPHDELFPPSLSLSLSPLSPHALMGMVSFSLTEERGFLGDQQGSVNSCLELSASIELLHDSNSLLSVHH